MRTMLILLAMLAATGCSNRAMYDNIQINQRNECLKLPPAQYDECMKHASKTYDEYERERQEYLESRLEPEPEAGETSEE